MSHATSAPTGAPTSARRVAGRAVAGAALVVGLGLVTSGPALAGLGGPLDPRDPTTTDEVAPTTAPAETPTTDGAEQPSSTVPTGATDPDAADDVGAEDDAADDGDGGGTSIAALGAVGIVAFILGLAVAGLPLLVALSRKKASSPAARIPAPATPAPSPAVGGPAIGAPPSRDADHLRHQRVTLVEALIALRDQLPSAALGDEAAGALASAGITELRPEGEPFDAARHRAVHQVATDDPARHNTIVSVERPGYADGTTVIRLPEVVVAMHGSPS